jgi:hypothetical protein
MTSERKPRLVDLPTIASESGHLTHIEDERVLPFVVRRVYFIYDVPAGSMRGNHAHRRCHELLVALNGSMRVVTETPDGTLLETTLEKPRQGLYIPPLCWRSLDRIAPGTVCLVLASETYDDAEYLRDYQEFRRTRA